MNGRLIHRTGCDYGALSGVNISTLMHLAKSPSHYRHVLDHQSSAMRLGLAVHAAVLEPDRFASEFSVVARVKPGQSRSDTEVTPDQHDTATAIARAVRVDALAMRYIARGEAEIALQRTDAETGIECKGRLDFVTHDHVVVDLKTARDATPWGFCGAAAKLDYHVKMAWYADAYETVTGHKPAVIVIAVENMPPYDAVCYSLEEDPEIEAGRLVYCDLLEKLAECRKTNQWPGIGNGTVQRFALPRWKLPDDEGDVMEGIEL